MLSLCRKASSDLNVLRVAPGPELGQNQAWLAGSQETETLWLLGHKEVKPSGGPAGQNLKKLKENEWNMSHCDQYRNKMIVFVKMYQLGCF